MIRIHSDDIVDSLNKILALPKETQEAYKYRIHTATKVLKTLLGDAVSPYKTVADYTYTHSLVAQPIETIMQGEVDYTEAKIYFTESEVRVALGKIEDYIEITNKEERVKLAFHPILAKSLLQSLYNTLNNNRDNIVRVWFGSLGHSVIKDPHATMLNGNIYGDIAEKKLIGRGILIKKEK